jgi:hypothetical protein
MSDPSGASVWIAAVAVGAIFIGAYLFGRFRSGDMEFSRDATAVGLAAAVLIGLALLFSNVGGSAFRAVAGIALLGLGAWQIRHADRAQMHLVAGGLAMVAGLLLVVDGVTGLPFR